MKMKSMCPICIGLIAIFLSIDLIGKGFATETVSYRISAFFGTTDYSTFNGIQWDYEGPSEKRRIQEYLLVGDDGTILFFQFTEKKSDASDRILSPNLFLETATQSVEVDKEKLVGLCSAFRALTSVNVFPSRIAGTKDTVIISTPHSPAIAYSIEELKSWNTGFEMLREAMREHKSSSQIEEICVKYWGTKRWLLDRN